MPRLSAFLNVSIDGCFADANGGMEAFYALRRDPDFQAFTEANASAGGRLVFGRKTYDMMASYWPTPLAQQQNPVVAAQMNAREKFVVSRTMTRADWANTAVLKGDLIAGMTKLKAAPGSDMVILGSGSLVSQLAEAGLLDGLMLVVNPVIFGDGRKLMEGFARILPWTLTHSRAFGNGAVSLTYAPA